MDKSVPFLIYGLSLLSPMAALGSDAGPSHAGQPAPHAAAPAAQPPAAPQPPPAERAAAPPAVQLEVGPRLNAPALAQERWLRPSRALSHVMLAPRCSAQETQLRLLRASSGELVGRKLPGRVWSLSWIDDARFAVVRTVNGATVLEVHSAQGDPITFIDTLFTYTPPSIQAAPARAPGLRFDCGADDDYYLLRSAGSRLAVTMRRDDTSFDVRRYVLQETAQGLTVRGRSLQRVGEASRLSERRLVMALPDLEQEDTVLVWQERPGGGAAALRLALERSRDGRVESRHLTHTSDSLASCAISALGQLLCHSRAGEEQGWLWTANLREPAPRPRQLTYGGQAAAFAISPDGAQVAYVGAGNQGGPLVLQDLTTGGRRQLATQEGDVACASAAASPLLTWADNRQLLVRGYCEALPVRVALRDPAEPTPPPAPAAPPPPAVMAAAPAERKAARRPQVAGRRVRPLGDRWLPRF